MHLSLTRRTFLHFTGYGAFGAATGAAASAVVPAPSHASSAATTELTPDQALALLKEGNRAFSEGRPTRPAQDRARRQEIARGQAPFAVLVTCSDSRVAPELLFDRGLGELFIVRNAGNTIDTVAMGSIEYAVAHLGVPLIVVLGHERCGAVQAAIEVVKHNADLPGSIGQMVEPIIPAVLKSQDEPGDPVDNAVRENVRRTVTHLRTSAEPMLLQPQQAGKLRVVGASYDLDNGAVDFFLET